MPSPSYEANINKFHASGQIFYTRVQASITYPLNVDMVSMPSNVRQTDPSTCTVIAPMAHPNLLSCNRETISAENVENVVSPPKKPVMINKRISGAIRG